MCARLAVVMDPISAINIKKDSTFAMMLEAQQRGYELWLIGLPDLYLIDGSAWAMAIPTEVFDDPKEWYREIEPQQAISLDSMELILMRKDPPFDMDFVYATYVLERAESAGARVVNAPQALRDANEKLFTAWFPQCCPPTVVTARADLLRDFARQHADVILKPLDGMGGTSIFKTSAQDANLNVIIETLTDQGKKLAMAQRFVPEISAGDKRVLLIDGEPVDYALARIPSAEDFRGNLARGGHGVGQPLSERDRWICSQVGKTLSRRGVVFAGLDIIGDYLTEVNVTSPTCIRELDAQFNLNIAGSLFDAIDKLETCPD